ncbi:hypothetical protein J437_LFUL006741, partial [Ladona fulva]
MGRKGKRKDEREPVPSTSGLSTKRRKVDSAGKREEVAEMSEQEIGTMLKSFLAEDDDSGSEWEWSEGDDSEESDSGEEDPAADTSPQFRISSPIPSPEPTSSGTVRDSSAWVADQPNGEPFVFAGSQGLKKLPDGNTPRDFFNLFATDGFYNHVVKETNTQAEEIFFRNPSPQARIAQWKELTVREFQIFLGLLLHMGTIQLNRLNDYWRKGKLFDLKCFSNFMSRDRFQGILQALHFSKNPESDEPIPKDRLYKIRPLIDLFHERMNDIYSPRKELCVDESMVLWRGRLIFRQYLKNKQHRHGLKVYMLTEPSGLVLKFIVYTGQADSEVGGHVVQHNTYMGGIALCDQLLSYYPCERKTMKWYKKLAIHIFQLMLINSFILYNRYSTKKLSLYDFRLELISSLLPDSVMSIQNSSKLSFSHFPDFLSQVVSNRRMQKRCRVCYLKGVRKNVTTYCPNCPDEPGLCLRPCFIDYHKDLSTLYSSSLPDGPYQSFHEPFRAEPIKYNVKVNKPVTGGSYRDFRMSSRKLGIPILPSQALSSHSYQ